MKESSPSPRHLYKVKTISEHFILTTSNLKKSSVDDTIKDRYFDFSSQSFAFDSNVLNKNYLLVTTNPAAAAAV